MNILPERERPTAATWNLEIGGRARVWAELTSDGRSWVSVRFEDSAINWASEASIWNLGWSIWEVELSARDCCVVMLL